MIVIADVAVDVLKLFVIFFEDVNSPVLAE